LTMKKGLAETKMGRGIGSEKPTLKTRLTPSFSAGGEENKVIRAKTGGDSAIVKEARGRP